MRVLPRAIATLAFSCFPVAVAFAVLRYRLFDINIVINRTLVYGALTASLGLGYWCGVVLLQQVLLPLTGGSTLAVVGATLLVAALVRPLRNGIQAAVDRRFFRRKYDAERTLAAFSSRLRDHVELDALRAELCSVVRETMRPAHVSLWLRTPSPGGGPEAEAAAPAARPAPASAASRGLEALG